VVYSTTAALLALDHRNAASMAHEARRAILRTSMSSPSRPKPRRTTLGDSGIVVATRSKIGKSLPASAKISNAQFLVPGGRSNENSQVWLGAMDAPTSHPGEEVIGEIGVPSATKLIEASRGSWLLLKNAPTKSSVSLKENGLVKSRIGSAFTSLKLLCRPV